MGKFEVVSAYEQLQPTQRMFVDGFVSAVREQAIEAGISILDYVHRAEYKAFRQPFENQPIFAMAMVRAAILDRFTALSQRMTLDPDKTRGQIAAIAYSSLGEMLRAGRRGSAFFSSYGGFEEWIEELSPEEALSLQAVKFNYKGMDGSFTIEIKMHDKLKALDMSARMLGMYEEDNAQKARQGMPVGSITADTSPEQAAELYARTLSDD